MLGIGTWVGTGREPEVVTSNPEGLFLFSWDQPLVSILSFTTVDAEHVDVTAKMLRAIHGIIGALNGVMSEGCYSALVVCNFGKTEAPFIWIWCWFGVGFRPHLVGLVGFVSTMEDNVMKRLLDVIVPVLVVS